MVAPMLVGENVSARFFRMSGAAIFSLMSSQVAHSLRKMFRVTTSKFCYCGSAFWNIFTVEWGQMQWTPWKFAGGDARFVHCRDNFVLEDFRCRGIQQYTRIYGLLAWYYQIVHACMHDRHDTRTMGMVYVRDRERHVMTWKLDFP